MGCLYLEKKRIICFKKYENSNVAEVDFCTEKMEYVVMLIIMIDGD